MTLPGSWRCAEQRIASLFNEATGGQFIDLAFLDRRIEAPVEILQTLKFSKRGRLHAPRQLSILTHQQFVLQDQLQEFKVREMVAAGLVQTDFQGFGQTRKS
jgi:hypothetical protein